MELVMKNNMMHVEKVKIKDITKGGLILDASVTAKLDNHMPFKVLAVEDNNPVGIQVGDYVYPKGPHGVFTGKLENEEATFMDIFNVLAVTKSFNPDLHAQVTYDSPIINN